MVSRRTFQALPSSNKHSYESAYKLSIIININLKSDPETFLIIHSYSIRDVDDNMENLAIVKILLICS